ncbi:hypothetical protein CANINC_000522, partial [Pichia inconspicua]
MTMKLVRILYLLLQLLVGLANSEIIINNNNNNNNNQKDGLVTVIYDCDTLTNCEHLIQSNTYGNKPHVFSFVQHQNSAVSYNDDANFVQKLLVDGSNFIFQKSGYFESSESGLYGFYFEGNNFHSSIQIDDVVHMTSGSDNSTFWIYLESNSIYSFSFTNVVSNLMLDTPIVVINPSGLREDILLFTYHSDPLYPNDSSTHSQVVKRDDTDPMDVPADVTFGWYYSQDLSYSDCYGSSQQISCSATPIITTVSDIVAKVYTETCSVPSDFIVVFHTNANVIRKTVNGTPISFTTTRYNAVSEVTCMSPTTLMDPKGAKITATCALIPTSTDPNGPRGRITSCEFSNDVAATFLASTRTLFDWTQTYYNIPTFSALTTTVAISNPLETGEVTCLLQLSTVSNGLTTSVPTTSCALPTNLPGVVTLSTSTYTLQGPETTATFTLSNYPFVYIPLPVKITVTNPVALTAEATCDVSFTMATAFDTPHTFATTSCLMPTEIQGTFIETLTTTTFTDGDQKSSIVITNVIIPTYTVVQSILTLMDPAGKIGDATCEIQYTTQTTNNKFQSFPTTSCAMPTDIMGKFVPVTSETIVSGFTYTFTNVNVPTFSAVQTTLPITDPAGKSGDATCEISFTTQVAGAPTVSIPTTSCSMPDDFSGTFIGEVSTTTLGDSTLTVTNVKNPQYSAASTYLVVTDPAGQTASASCAINLTPIIVATTTIAIPTTTCEMPDEIDGFFIDGISTTVFTDGDFTTILTATNLIVPQYEAVVTTLPFLNPTGKAEVGKCAINLTTATALGTTIALPTTLCDMPNEQGLEFVARTSTTVFSYDGSSTTITLTNTANPSFPAVEQTITVTDFAGHIEAATCAIAFTEIDASQSIASVATTSCEMPAGLQGTFSATTTVATVTNGEFTTIVTLTNINEPQYFAITTSMVLVDPINATGEAICNIDATSVTVADTTVLVPTTSCQMPVDLTGSFEFATSTTTVSGFALTVTNTNVPVFDAVESVLTITGPTGDAHDATCEIQLTSTAVGTTTASVATTSCSMPADVDASFETTLSTTTITVGGEQSTFVVTNVNVAVFPTATLIKTVTNPAGVIGEATCAVTFTKPTAFGSTVSIPTTSCSMPEDLSGTFVEGLSTTEVTNGAETSTLVVTNKDVTSFTASSSQSSSLSQSASSSQSSSSSSSSSS